MFLPATLLLPLGEVHVPSGGWGCDFLGLIVEGRFELAVSLRSHYLLDRHLIEEEGAPVERVVWGAMLFGLFLEGESESVTSFRVLVQDLDGGPVGQPVLDHFPVLVSLGLHAGDTLDTELVGVREDEDLFGWGAVGGAVQDRLS